MNIAVFISGSGTNLKAMIDRLHKQCLRITVVFSDQPCTGLEHALTAKIPVIYLPKYKAQSKEQYDQKIVELLSHFEIDLIALAGYMKIITDVLIEAYDGKIINLHPSLLPKYKGLNTFERALNAGEAQHGSSVHLVTTGLDDGEIIAQTLIDVEHDETISSLMEKTKLRENVFYPEVLSLFATGQLSIRNRHAFKNSHPLTIPMIL